MKFQFAPAKGLQRQYKSYRKDINTIKKIDAVIIKLLNDPFTTDLKTHQVHLPSIGKCWSSRVTGDLRILWKFSEKNALIVIGLRIGGHDTVYK